MKIKSYCLRESSGISEQVISRIMDEKKSGLEVAKPHKQLTKILFNHAFRYVHR